MSQVPVDKIKAYLSSLEKWIDIWEPHNPPQNGIAARKALTITRKLLEVAEYYEDAERVRKLQRYGIGQLAPTAIEECARMIND